MARILLSLLIFLIASPANAAFSIYQNALGANNSSATDISSQALAGTKDIQSNDCVLGFIMYAVASSTAPSSVVDNATTQDTLTIFGSTYDSTNGNEVSFFGGCALHTSTAAGQITVNWSSAVASYVRMAWIEVSGASSIDTDVVSGVTDAGSGSFSTSNITPSAADFLYAPLANSAGGAAVTFTAGTNVAWTIENNGGTGPDEAIADEYFSPATSGTGVAGEMTVSTAGDKNFIGAIIALKPQASGGASGASFFHANPIDYRDRSLVGWRLPLIGLGVWRAAKAVERNGVITRRRLILPRRRTLIGHNGGPKLDD